MTKEELLTKIREDRPGQVINEVLSFEKNKFGWIDVEVDMEIPYDNIIIHHVRMSLPYPIEVYRNKMKQWNLA